ncbi:MAG TPA: hypothetical protein VEC11_15765 [Allosphingosinicella sp.]|nr:hypothetical protein [Allosphingosinicella sp.]
MRLALVTGLTAVLLAVPAAVLALAAMPAMAQERPPSSQSVTVTGARIQTYRDRLAACLARRCPVNEDVDATMALTEVLFLEGDYDEARSTVLASLGRNRRQAARHPEPVADLYRVNSRLSRHLGFDAQAARSTDNILRSLQLGIPREDYRHFTARLEIADLQMAMGNANRARRELGELIAIARANGREDVAVMAELRTIWFDYIVSRQGDSRRRLEAMAAITDPAQRLRQVGATVLLSRMYRANGEAARADALLAALARRSSPRRRLISSPSYQLAQQEVADSGDVIASAGGPDATRMAVGLGSTIHRIPQNYRDKWIDVGFWVMPDGRVTGLEIVRNGSGVTSWSEPLLEAIRGRVYSRGPEPTYRLERYTYTAGYREATGTRMMQQSPRARVEYLDLTTSDELPGPPPRPEGDGGRPAA